MHAINMGFYKNPKGKFLMNNPFSLTFGIVPNNYIDRSEESKNIIEEFSSETPSNLVYLISGLRGSGKTVFMSSIADYFSKKEDWMVVDPGPKDNILENVASEIYETGKMKHAFLKGEFSFSFQGLTFSLKGETPVSTVNTLLKKMLDVLSKKNKKVLKAIGVDTPVRFGNISKVDTIDPKTLSVYRDRFIKRGLLLKTSYGFVQFALPRFSEFLLFK